MARLYSSGLNSVKRLEHELRCARGASIIGAMGNRDTRAVPQPEMDAIAERPRAARLALDITPRRSGAY